jgi:hypothetical protein
MRFRPQGKPRSVTSPLSSRTETGVVSTRSAPAARTGPVSVNDPDSGRSSDAPPMATETSPGSTIRVPSRPGEGGAVGVQPEGHPGALSRCERHPGEPGQQARRPHHGGHRVAQVELNHLGPGDGANHAWCWRCLGMV